MIRDRIKELRRVPAKDLVPHSRNWRTHPPEQQTALKAVLRELGYCDAAIARELPDGRLQLLDGHLRRDLATDEPIPVLVLDVDEHEGDKLLLTLDPLAGMAEADSANLSALVQSVQTDDEAIIKLLAQLAKGNGLLTGAQDKGKAVKIPPSSFEVVVQCEGEGDQRELFDRLTKEGWTCRVITF